MLADSPDNSARIGLLSKEVHKPATFLHELLDFIAEELPRWRDRPERQRETSETVLTSPLCAHLNSRSRHRAGWDILQFRVEEPDALNRGRKIDLVAAPSGTTICIDGRRHTDFDSIMPIECKRLPTPKEKDRDEREYVISRYSSTGGIQRFKAGHHGANHLLGGMIGYVQEETTRFWEERIAGWINDLVETNQLGWTKKDLLHSIPTDASLQLAQFHSIHEREKQLPEIRLRHLWLKMN